MGVWRCVVTYTFSAIEGAFRVLAWGRGVPSTTLGVMAMRGDLERLDAVLHCDPGWEHSGTYEVGDFYSGLLGRGGGYVEVIETGDIRREGAREHIHIPFWTETGGPLQRQCTRHYKVDPQKRRVRELLGFHPSKAPAPRARAVEQWIGFTMEEVDRMRMSRVQYVVMRWPLIELGMSRRDCVDYLEGHGLPIPPPSSCVGCPYKDAGRWLTTSVDEFGEAVAFDEENRDNPLAVRGNSTADQLFVYRERRAVALADAPLELDARRGLRERHGQLSLFGCGEGACGV